MFTHIKDVAIKIIGSTVLIFVETSKLLTEFYSFILWHRNARSNDNTASVFTEDTNLSVSSGFQEMNLSETTTWRILQNDLDLHK